ncbi:centaurin-beta-2 [Aureobasidium melanogenum CBS 110374]|uniref:ADP-ribosylation factor GTPase-activating protein n=1 Tax=Aureobasidium melanogenum (strain CBS 110374) TaxID=1043003 RepID=A0A074VVF7_AURM1|nr:centaurin-beta-2 [Aureobasidium melanogenum CBS 110374]KEQ63229.1 centaurin-beta-2 [Aureobasidium melanogenum CBS 110374]
MGNVGSRPDDASPVYFRDQTRFSIANVNITNSRGRTLVSLTPNSFPATRYQAKRDTGDNTPVDYVQDPEPPSILSPSFLLRLANDEELTFNFTCVLRQSNSAPTNTIGDHVIAPTGVPASDTQLCGLTYVIGSKAKEIDQLVTRGFHFDPNIHKNPNVELVGDYSTGGVPSVQFQWSWKWRPPKQSEDYGGGWRNTCSFVEYNSRAHRLETLASFSFWVTNTQRWLNSPTLSPPRLRVPSSQSIESRVSAVSDSDPGDPKDYRDFREPSSPMFDAIPEYGLGLVPSMTNGGPLPPPKVDISCVGRPAEDASASEDGPVFRATMRALEQKTGTMRSRMKKVLRAAEAAQAAQTASNDAHSAFMDALREASNSNANAVRPALEHYFDSIAREILLYERQNNANLQKLIIEPINKLYSLDIKQAESKRRDFDEESKDYYAYVSKYLGQRSESLKEKKRAESDAKYQAKRRTFELKRFDYSSFMHDLNGGRKEQEVLSQLTKYASAQARGYLTTAKKVEEMLPQLEALTREVSQADMEFQLQRTEREEKRRALETNNAKSPEIESPPSVFNGSNATHVDRASSIISAPRNSIMSTSPSASNGFPSSITSSTSPSSNGALPVRNTSNKFKGIRDLEEKDNSASAVAGAGQFKKEGLLWSLSRPGSHVDPIMNKAGWHKFWIVLDQGKLSEYANWKDKLDLHMDPIDLRVASVREARNADRRFCFEVITPQYTRVYQAPSEEDMKSWIASINNALQSAFESRPSTGTPSTEKVSSTRNTIAAVLTGKTTPFSSQRASTNATSSYISSSSKIVSRHATTGDKPTYMKPDNETPSALLNQIREADAGNKYCADCNSDQKVEWVSINLGIILCIECSGIHRSLGTHISKVRSLTLDTSAFTPDIIELLMLVGNRVSNMVWEAKLDAFLKPGPNVTREQRLHFITGKYSDRLYVQSSTDAMAHFKSPDDTLLVSIKQNNIQQVLYALALRANPNATDRSRGTHAVFLALAAADPASPSSSFVQQRSGSSTLKPFPVAELLLQNGAEIPTQPAPIPLSRAAQQYIEFKIDQKTGRHLGLGVKDSAGDVLSALPSEKHSPNDRDSRLMKRQSTGSRVSSRDGSIGRR